MLSTAATNASAGTMFLSREQYLFNVFEVLVSTLESKLQRIENLDRAVEHLMRRVETLDGKADAVMARLRALSLPTTGNAVEARLAALDRKVSAMDAKLGSIRQSLDAPEDIIGAAASEKKATVVDAGAAAAAAVAAVPKALSGQLDALRSASSAVDRKLQFHINVVSESLGRALALLRDVHAAVVEAAPANNTASKLDRLARQMGPVLSVSDKMAEVWDVVVGTKSSVDGLVPAADKLLTQTQRQERALSDAHADLRNKANEIIANLDLVERRLQQAPLVSGPASASAPATGFLPPSLVPPQDLAAPYDVELTTPAPEVPATTLPPPPPPQPVAPSTPAPTTTPSTTTSTTAAAAASAASSSLSSARATTRSRNVIFPSVKNKPTLANTSFTTDALQGIKDVKGYSCLDLQNAGMRDSGVYYLQIRGTTYWFLKVFCEQDAGDGGWTVIQRRDDFGEPRENFNRDWNDYKNGFGDPAREFWLGNENIYMLTNNEEYMLRVELEDFEGNKRYAQYTHFKIYSEAEYYKLEIDGYDGNAGDSLNDPWYGSNNSPFSTYNRDNDRSSLNCASMLKGGWWWKSCGRGLNGLYLNDPQDLTARQGIVWFRWRGWDYTLKKAVMMIKPRGNIKGEGAANVAS